MPAVALMLVAFVVVLVAYRTYGTHVASLLGLDDRRATPAHTRSDGVDYVPSSRPVVLGHHFASIAGAGPIVGPIAAAAYGWLPAFLWILIGVVFIGAVHDLTTLVASLRHDGRSIGDIVEDYVGLTAKRLFLAFGIAALLLVVGVFTNVVARTFVREPTVATTSAAFMVLAVAFGFVLRRRWMPLWLASALGVAGMLGCVALGAAYPIEASYSAWVWALMAYIAVAAIAPVWILLQPRDYLNSFLLYGMLGAGTIGLFFARPSLQLPPVTGLYDERLGFIFPILFVTVACGAISGFHSLVASGTTSKQIDRESDAKFIGYGGMLLEGLLAVLALVAAGMMTRAEYGAALTDPIGIFAGSVGGFIGLLGVGAESGSRFVALAVSAFALTSLDTCTRLARILVAELLETAETRAHRNPQRERGVRMGATLAVVGFGGWLTLSQSFTGIWPIFGAANQLLAALALLSVAAWLAHEGKRTTVVVIPMVFMFGVTFVALGKLVWSNAQAGNTVLAALASVLLALACVLLVQSGRAVLSGGAVLSSRRTS